MTRYTHPMKTYILSGHDGESLQRGEAALSPEIGRNAILRNFRVVTALSFLFVVTLLSMRNGTVAEPHSVLQPGHFPGRVSH